MAVKRRCRAAKRQQGCHGHIESALNLDTPEARRDHDIEPDEAEESLFFTATTSHVTTVWTMCTSSTESESRRKAETG
jgi:3-mercaptopyruvate sulfurtransferase SseA